MAASAQAVEAGNAFVRVWANLTDLDKGLSDAKQRLSAFSGSLATLGGALALGFATSKITGWINSFAEAGKEIYVMARAAGISAAEISELKGAIGLLGGDLGETVAAMRKMGIFLNDVSTGGREAADAMHQLGLSIADVANLSETDKLQLIGERLATIPLNARQALGRKIFGRGGGAIVGIAGALGAAREQTAGSGQTEAELKAAFDLAQALVMLEKAQKAIGKTIGGLLAPAVQLITESMTGAAKTVKTWVKDNGELIQKIVLVGSVVAGTAAGLVAMATAVKLVIFTASGIQAVFAGLVGVVTAAAGIIAFMFTPLGLALGAATALFAMFGNIRGITSSLGAIFNETFGGIRDAIMGGDLALAWEIAVASFRTVWADFTVWMKDTLGLTMIDAIATIKIAFVEAVAFMKTLMAGVSNPGGVGAIFAAGARGVANQIAGRPANAGGGPGAPAFMAELAAIEAERQRARAAISAAQAGGNAAVGQDAINARIDLENALEAASIAAGAAEARRNAAVAGIAPGLEAMGGGTARSTFAGSAISGLGGTSPFARLENLTQAQLDVLRDMLAGIDKFVQPEVV